MALKFPGKKFNFTYEQGKEIEEKVLLEKLAFLITSDENVTGCNNMILNFSSFLDKINEIDRIIKKEVKLVLQGKSSPLESKIRQYLDEYCLIYGKDKDADILAKFHISHVGTLLDKDKQILFADYEMSEGNEAGVLVFYFNKDFKIEKAEIEF